MGDFSLRTPLCVSKNTLVFNKNTSNDLHRILKEANFLPSGILYVQFF